MANKPKKSRADFERKLNDKPVPKRYLRVNGGTLNRDGNYGSWMRKNDPIQFGVLFNKWLME